MYEWWNLFFTDMKVFFWTCAAVPVLILAVGLGVLSFNAGIVSMLEMQHLRQQNLQLKARLTAERKNG